MWIIAIQFSVVPQRFIISAQVRYSWPPCNLLTVSLPEGFLLWCRGDFMKATINLSSLLAYVNITALISLHDGSLRWYHCTTDHCVDITARLITALISLHDGSLRWYHCTTDHCADQCVITKHIWCRSTQYDIVYARMWSYNTQYHTLCYCSRSQIVH